MRCLHLCPVFFGRSRVALGQQQQQQQQSLFQIKYSLQSLCPQLAKAIRGGYKRKKKLYKYIYKIC